MQMDTRLLMTSYRPSKSPPSDLYMVPSPTLYDLTFTYNTS